MLIERELQYLIIRPYGQIRPSGFLFPALALPTLGYRVHVVICFLTLKFNLKIILRIYCFKVGKSRHNNLVINLAE